MAAAISEATRARRSDVATASLGVAGLLLGIAGAGAAPPAAGSACEAPHERVAHAGWSHDVGCDLRAEAPLRGPARLLFGLALDVNEADARALETLPGIGPGRAAAIVAARERSRFTRLEDLLELPGIGPRTLAGLAGALEVAAAAAPAPGERRGSPRKR